MDERIIRKSLEILGQRTVIASEAIEPWHVREAEYAPDMSYTYLGDWEALTPQATFAALRTVFCRATVSCASPTSARGKLYLAFPGMRGVEGLLKVDGRAYAGLDANHERVAAPEPGEHLLEVEFVSWLRAMCQPELLSERAAFGGASLIEVDADLEAALYDLRVVADAIPHVPDARRKGRLGAALEEALLAIDLTLQGEDLALEVERARWLLRDRLAEIQPDPEGGKVCLVGHTHIDTAWLWPLSETIRKCGRTFSTAARLMEQYPDYHFACSQAQLYAYTKEHYPELYAEIKEWVRTGRWETTGAMWVETDCNVPSGESLIRQMVHGLAFYRDEFGTRPRTCWLPDVFGYPASLPGILKGCGVPYFMTCKLHWQSQNPFPHHLFWWEGIDGSQVLAHIPKLMRYYNGSPTPEQLRIAWENYAEKAEYDEVMLPFGFGDGGGGVTSEMLEYAARAKSFPGLPATRVASGEDYYERVMEETPALSTWQGELYLETHRGTYTTQSRTKRANRKSELLLRDAEILGSWANIAGGRVEMLLEDAWKRVLLQQFHDILPGSSIGQVYADALDDHDKAQAAALHVRSEAIGWLAGQHAPEGSLVVLNSLSWNRSDPVVAMVPDPGGPFHLRDSQGRTCRVQVLSRGNGQAGIIFEPFAVSGFGLEAFTILPGDPGALDEMAAWDRGLENAAFRVEFNDDGEIVRLLDKRHGREVVATDEPANVWQLFQDGPEREAAWNVHGSFEGRQYAFQQPAQITVIGSGPVRATLRIQRTYRDSQMSLEVHIYRRSPRIDFVADVDWQERQTMLKIAFPAMVRSPEATCEIQFGAVQRPTHRNTSWDQAKFEVCAHHWADLSEAGYGVSLLNDSRYGYDVKGNTLRLTALRGPEYPDPEADLGMHHVAYALWPHQGDWRAGDTVRSGWEFNVPMVGIMSPGSGRAGSAQLLKVEGEGLVVSALKPAEDGEGYILRLYESLGGRGTGRVTFGRTPKRVVVTNLVEEDIAQERVAAGGTSFDYAPFSIRAFRLVW